MGCDPLVAGEASGECPSAGVLHPDLSGVVFGDDSIQPLFADSTSFTGCPVHWEETMDLKSGVVEVVGFVLPHSRGDFHFLKVHGCIC